MSKVASFMAPCRHAAAPFAAALLISTVGAAPAPLSPCGINAVLAGNWCECFPSYVAFNLTSHSTAVASCGSDGVLRKSTFHLGAAGEHCICLPKPVVVRASRQQVDTACGTSLLPRSVVVGDLCRCNKQSEGRREGASEVFCEFAHDVATRPPAGCVCTLVQPQPASSDVTDLATLPPLPPAISALLAAPSRDVGITAQPADDAECGANSTSEEPWCMCYAGYVAAPRASVDMLVRLHPWELEGCDGHHGYFFKSLARQNGLWCGCANADEGHVVQAMTLSAAVSDDAESKGQQSESQSESTSAGLFYNETLLPEGYLGITCLAFRGQRQQPVIFHAFNPGIVRLPPKAVSAAQVVFPTAVYLATVRLGGDQCGALKRVTQPEYGFLERARRKQDLVKPRSLFVVLDDDFLVVGEVRSYGGPLGMFAEDMRLDVLPQGIVVSFMTYVHAHARLRAILIHKFRNSELGVAKNDAAPVGAQTARVSQ